MMSLTLQVRRDHLAGVAVVRGLAGRPGVVVDETPEHLLATLRMRRDEVYPIGGYLVGVRDGHLVVSPTSAIVAGLLALATGGSPTVLGVRPAVSWAIDTVVDVDDGLSLFLTTTHEHDDAA
jgi:hypothetical protein